MRLVYDPVTQADIEVGSLLFRMRTEPLAPNTAPPFIYHEGINELAMQWNDGTLQTRQIQYDDVEDRDITLPVPDDGARLVILRMIDELSFAPVNRPRVMALLTELRQAVLEFSDEPFIASHFISFSYQGVEVDTRGLGVNTAPATANQQAMEFQQQPLGADVSLRLPFVNIDMNDGTENECVDRFLNMDLRSTPHLRNVDGMLEMAELFSFSITLYDILGCVMAQHEVPTTTDVDGFVVPHFRGLVFDAHVYPIKNNSAPTLLRFPVKRYETTQQVFELIRNSGTALFMMNNTFYVPNVGLMRPMGKCVEPWMDPFLELLPTGHGWDPTSLGLIKRSSLALHYNAPGVEDGLDPAEHVAFDISKCYYHMMLFTLDPKNPNKALGRPSIFDRFRPVSSQDVHYWCYYKCDVEMGWRQRLGILTDVLMGRMVAMLRFYGLKVTVTHELRFDSMSPIGHKHRREAYKMMLNWTPEQQKKFAVVNGLMGRIRRKNRYQFQIHDAVEADYYILRHQAQRWGDTMIVEQESFDLVNRVHWHAHVIQMANIAVLDRALLVYRETGVWPVKIKVDSLTYRLHDFRTPWETVGNGRVAKFFENPTLGAPWHPEAVKNPETFCPATSYRVLDLPDNETYANTTYIGPPGTGKTYSAMRNHNIDIAVCFSNKGARRVGGRTIHSAFGLWGEKGYPALDAIRGKTIFIDEFQAVPRRLIAYCMRAYHEVGARFVFAMDVNQLPPVGERPIVPEGSPFMGNVIRLTTEHRNDPALVEARRQILSRSFTPPVFQPVRLVDGKLEFSVPVEAMCIAYRVETCRIVNEHIRKQLGIAFGSPRGRYIVATPNRRYNVLKSELIKRRGNCWVRSDGTTFECEPWKAQKFLEWGFCVTIHKMIGETVDGPLAIFDWDFYLMDRFIKYTAITRACRFDDIRFYRTFPKEGTN